MRFLNLEGIDAYFSGCLTLTLPERSKKSSEDFIVLSDLDDGLEKFYIKQSKNYLPIKLGQDFPFVEDNDNSMFSLIWQKNISICLQKQSVLVTSKLHVAKPCLALKTPVLLVSTQQDQYRFSGLNTLVRNASK